MSSLVVVVSDTHTNSRSGLIPPQVSYDTGAIYSASPEQLWLWAQWLELCQYINRVAYAARSKVVVVFNGDGPDRNRHSGGYDLISLSRSEIINWTVESLQPLRAVADVWIHNRGTPAHEGGTGELAEIVAEKLDATKAQGRRAWSWWNVKTIVDGVYFLVGHRPISSSYREHTRGGGAMRTARDLWQAYLRMGDRCPDVGVFSHVHHYEDSGNNCPMRVVYTPAWKLCDAYGHSRGFGQKTEPVGAWLFFCKDGEYTPELWRRQPPNEPYTTLK